MKDSFRDTLLNSKIREVVQNAAEQWKKGGEIVCSEVGEAWKLPET